MRIRVLQHVPFEGLGHVAAWAARRQARIDWSRLYDDPALPDPADLDLLVALGGPMSVNDEALLPWLRPEKHFIADVLAAGKPVLGICLGAQLMACALGAAVRPALHKEIGWFPVFGENSPPDTFSFPSEILAFHWHGETFDLPPGCPRLARSAACPNQAFQFGPCAIGLQFHLETTPADADALCRHCADDMAPGRWVQPASEILAAPHARHAPAHGLAERLLDYLVRPI